MSSLSRIRIDDAHPARPRPAWLRALGKSEPPERVTVGGRCYHRVEVFKHDSWAATALYRPTEAETSTDKIVCKFNRVQSVLGLPCRWIGRRLASRESAFLRSLADVAGVPRELGAVAIDGALAPHAVAREFIEGRPLGSRQAVRDEFFSDLQSLLSEVHRRKIAYVDLHKRENVLVGADGKPYLIDFQVSFGSAGRWSGRLLSILQRMDDYHRLKLHRKCRPDQCRLNAAELAEARPWLVRVHRRLAQPLRSLRRRLLTALGVRRGAGRAESEHFAEAALRSTS